MYITKFATTKMNIQFKLPHRVLDKKNQVYFLIYFSFMFIFYTPIFLMFSGGI